MDAFAAHERPSAFWSWARAVSSFSGACSRWNAGVGRGELRVGQLDAVADAGAVADLGQVEARLRVGERALRGGDRRLAGDDRQPRLVDLDADLLAGDVDLGAQRGRLARCPRAPTPAPVAALEDRPGERETAAPVPDQAVDVAPVVGEAGRRARRAGP